MLSAPDLQLDWVSDSSSDDGVMLVGDDSNAVSIPGSYVDFYLYFLLNYLKWDLNLIKNKLGYTNALKNPVTNNAHHTRRHQTDEYYIMIIIIYEFDEY